jgi:hypothetical protein
VKGKGDEFPVRQPKDVDGITQVIEGEEDRFQYGRNGDHLMLSFQCGLCHFRNMEGRNPVKGNNLDDRVLMLIRRATLDSFWSREPATVKGTLRNGSRLEDIVGQLGLSPAVEPMGPFPIHDSVGMKLAVAMLVRSLDPGKTEQYVQFGTVRTLRSAYSNMYHASKEHLGGVSVLTGGSRKLVTTNCPSNGFWFDRFMVGYYKRVGQLLVQDMAISIEVILAVQDYLEAQWNLTRTDAEKRSVSEMGVIFVICFCLGLRGEEMLMIDIAGCRKHLVETRQHSTPHVLVALWGRFKQQPGECHHLMPVVDRTASGLRAGEWLVRLLDCLERQGVVNGKLLQGKRGEHVRLGKFADPFYTCLEHVQTTRPDLIDAAVEVREDYGLSRSCRRGVTTHARNVGVHPDVVNANNRWRVEESARGGGRPWLTMQDYYTEVKQSLPLLLKFSGPL